MNTKVGTWVHSLALAAALCTAPAAVNAATLQVSPINVEVVAPGAASTVTLGNEGEGIINAQVRVFKWVQINGKEQLIPTKDVVASPPALKIKQGGKGTVRIVRLVKSPATTEESYRLLVDEIPPPQKNGSAAVSFAIRHNIPVFFTSPGLNSKLNWSASAKGGVLRIAAVNTGERRARLAQLSVAGASGKVSVNDGLAGYVLGGGSNAWTIKTKAIAAGNTVKISAVGNDGPVEATVQVQ